MEVKYIIGPLLPVNRQKILAFPKVPQPHTSLPGRPGARTGRPGSANRTARRAMYPRRPRRVALRCFPIFSPFPRISFSREFPLLPTCTIPAILVLRSEISHPAVTVVHEITMRNNFRVSMESSHHPPRSRRSATLPGNDPAYGRGATCCDRLCQAEFPRTEAASNMIYISDVLTRFFDNTDKSLCPPRLCARLESDKSRRGEAEPRSDAQVPAREPHESAFVFIPGRANQIYCRVYMIELHVGIFRSEITCSGRS